MVLTGLHVLNAFLPWLSTSELVLKQHVLFRKTAVPSKMRQKSVNMSAISPGTISPSCIPTNGNQGGAGEVW
jgi:hypothetical protein